MFGYEEELKYRLNKEIKKLKTRISSVEKDQELEQQTLMFWQLQLQFMEMPYMTLYSIAAATSPEISRRATGTNYDEVVLSYATELALHLSGIE